MDLLFKNITMLGEKHTVIFAILNKNKEKLLFANPLKLN